MDYGRTPSELPGPLQHETHHHYLFQVIGPLELHPDRNATSPILPLLVCLRDEAKLKLVIGARTNCFEPPFGFAMTPLAPSEDGDRWVWSCGRRLALNSSCGQPYSRFLPFFPFEHARENILHEKRWLRSIAVIAVAGVDHAACQSESCRRRFESMM